MTVIAGGPITQTSGNGITQNLVTNDQVAGAVSFATGGFPILLDNPFNAILGAISLKATGANGIVNVNNETGIVLGTVNVGGSLSISASSGITQAPGTAST